ncbi:MAG: hypothetical protein GY710_09340 [Desulfobacteraceae bacterium]|nr:hypothetical protein [Desulfobacteraceae bacterium]
MKRIDELEIEYISADIDNLKNEITEIRELSISIKNNVQDIKKNMFG